MLQGTCCAHIETSAANRDAPIHRGVVLPKELVHRSNDDWHKPRRVDALDDKESAVVSCGPLAIAKDDAERPELVNRLAVTEILLEKLQGPPILER